MGTRMDSRMRGYNPERERTASMRSGYVSGSAARQLQEIPERRPERRPECRPERRPQQQIRPVSIPVLSRSGFVCCCVVVAVICGCCLSFLHTQNQLTVLKKNVATMQSQNAEMKAENLGYQQEIEGSVDLSYVYQVATKRLGMVRAKNNQVYLYENKKSDMVKKYAEIPSGK